MEFKFDHSKESYLEACGITEEQIDTMYNKINEIGNAAETSSELVEKLGKEFTATEMAFVVNNLQERLRQPNPMEMMMEVLGGMGDGPEEPEVKVIPMSEGGES